MAGSTILVIDGDPASRNYVAAALEKEGHRVLQAGSGREGLIYAWRDHPDLIIADPALGDLTGEEFAARLRQKLEADAHNPRHIVTRSGLGYFMPPTEA